MIEIRARGNNVAAPNDVAESEADLVTHAQNVDDPSDVVADTQSVDDPSNDEGSDAETESSIDTPSSSQESD
jgi:hypothetical protein